jgi:hypothetical protein
MLVSWVHCCLYLYRTRKADKEEDEAEVSRRPVHVQREASGSDVKEGWKVWVDMRLKSWTRGRVRIKEMLNRTDDNE